MRLRREPAIQIKSAEQVDRMYAAGQVVARTLEVLREAVRPGVSTAELDALAEREIRSAGAVPSFLGYFGYPASICTSVNEQVVHGIPDGQQVLHDGDLISIDCGAILNGWHGDSALTVGVGQIDPADQAMLDACEAAMWAGIAAAADGQRLGDVVAVRDSRRREGPPRQLRRLVPERVDPQPGQIRLQAQLRGQRVPGGGRGPETVDQQQIRIEHAPPPLCR